MSLSLGVSMGLSRFRSQKDILKRSESIKINELNSVEFGLLNCTIGRSTIPGTLPFPTDKQIQHVAEFFPSQLP